MRPPTFAGIACAAFGGPLALAALYGPAAVRDLPGSAGSAAVVAPVAFTAVLAIWLRYNRDVAGPGGLFAYADAAAGRRVATVHGVAWIASYTLYLLYTSAYVVYDVLPVAWPGIGGWRPVLAVTLPLALAGLAAAGPRATLPVIAGIGFAQLPVVALVDGVALHHAPSADAFGSLASSSGIHATGGIATLFVCGSLPLFLGGEVAAARRRFAAVLPVVLVLAAIGVVLGTYPLARDPAFLHADIPAAALAGVEVGSAARVVVGVGVAVSVTGLLLLELVALSRLLRALAGGTDRQWVRRFAVVLAASGPLSLAVGPQRFYDDLLPPSLVLLWVAQLIVVAVFPRYLARRARIRVGHLALTAVAVALTGFGLVTSVQSGGAS